MCYWESKAKYYRDRRKYKEVSRKLREVYARFYVLCLLMQEIIRTQGLVKLSIQMRLRNSTYYEGEDGNFWRGYWGLCVGRCVGGIRACKRTLRLKRGGGMGWSRVVVRRKFWSRLGNLGRSRPPP